MVNIPLPEIMVLLSGGVDSTACLNFYLKLERPTCGMFIDYQQPAAKREAHAALTIANYYGIPLYSAKWRGNNKKPLGLIPARNAFLLFSALMERPSQVTTIVLGIHAGTDYADCSLEFIDLMQNIFDIYSKKHHVQIAAPFINWSKGDIWAYALSQNIPIDITYSCENGSKHPCGKCLSCLDRIGLEAHA